MRFRRARYHIQKLYWPMFTEGFDSFSLKFFFLQLTNQPAHRRTPHPFARFMIVVNRKRKKNNTHNRRMWELVGWVQCAIVHSHKINNCICDQPDHWPQSYLTIEVGLCVCYDFLISQIDVIWKQTNRPPAPTSIIKLSKQHRFGNKNIGAVI